VFQDSGKRTIFNWLAPGRDNSGQAAGQGMVRLSYPVNLKIMFVIFILKNNVL
jgi:hypothetical protein